MSGLDDERLITAFHQVVLVLVVSWMIGKLFCVLSYYF